MLWISKKDFTKDAIILHNYSLVRLSISHLFSTSPEKLNVIFSIAFVKYFFDNE